MKNKFLKNTLAVFLILAARENFAADCPTLLEQAEKYYFQLEYSKSLQALEAFRQICPSEIQSWVIAAQIHGAQGKRKEAAADFQELLSANPAYELDAAQYPPSLQKIFKEAKEIVEQQRIVALQQPIATPASAPMLAPTSTPPTSPIASPPPHRRKIPKGLILGGLGALGAGILAAVLTTRGGGGGEAPAAQVSSSSASTGNVAIEFK